MLFRSKSRETATTSVSAEITVLDLFYPLPSTRPYYFRSHLLSGFTNEVLWMTMNNRHIWLSLSLLPLFCTLVLKRMFPSTGSFSEKDTRATNVKRTFLKNYYFGNYISSSLCTWCINSKKIVKLTFKNANYI